MTLIKSPDRLLQLVNVPNEEVLVRSCGYQVLVCTHRVEGCSATSRIDVSDTLIAATVPYLDEPILTRSHEDVNEVFIISEGLRAVDGADWSIVLFRLIFRNGLQRR